MKDIGEKIIEAQIYNHQEWISEINPDTLKRVYEERLILAGFKIVAFNEHFFSNNGYTCFWLLAESHLAIHTFPDSNKTYVELSSCNHSFLEKFVNQGR